MSEKNQKPHETGFYTPRPHLSWSQIQLFERSPALYVKRYIYGETAETEAMRLGKRLSEVLETREETGDEALDNLVSLFPNYPEREYEIKASLDGVDVPLFGRLDCFDSERLRIGEIKSGRLWTQKMVDESGQLKMYALLVWLTYKRAPAEVILYWAKTQYTDNGELKFTGEIESFETKITLDDVLIFSDRVREAWAGIKNLCEEHYGII